MKSNDQVVSAYETAYSPTSHTSPWSPKTWTRKIWLLIVAGILVVVAAVVGGVVGSRAARNKDGGSYPNYSKINYTLIDTCEWNPESSCVFWECVHGKRLTATQIMANPSSTSSSTFTTTTLVCSLAALRLLVNNTNKLSTHQLAVLSTMSIQTTPKPTQANPTPDPYLPNLY